MKLNEAIDIVARAALETAVDDLCDEGWELYPEVGEEDWELVCERMDDIVGPSVRTSEMTEAYALLEARAVAWEKANS